MYQVDPPAPDPESGTYWYFCDAEGFEDYALSEADRLQTERLYQASGVPFTVSQNPWKPL